ncbi:MAG: hypothetical protein LBG88_03045 [Christensenellaceae bacterium]|jgi:hypothetical protein|nr:hypothetical protein [Christensenellaceae bacterium]
MDKLTFDDFIRMEEIDHNIGFKSIVPAPKCFEIYKKFPQYICALKEQDKVIGYVSTVAVEKELYERLKSGEVGEDAVNLANMSFSNPVYLYITCVVIDRPYQNLKNVKALFDKYKAHMKSLFDNGMQVAEVLTECETELYYLTKKSARRIFLYAVPRVRYNI